MGYNEGDWLMFVRKVIGRDVPSPRAVNCLPFTTYFVMYFVTMESLDDLLRRFTLSQQQLRERCEANIAESKRIVEHSRKLIEQSYIILNKAGLVRKP
jgi:hypothetical protein